MKFSYILSRWLGTIALVIVSILGLSIIGGVTALGYFVKDEALLDNIIKTLNETIAQLSQQGDSTAAPAELIKTLTDISNFLSSNINLVIDIGNGLFIGGIAFASVMLFSLFIWACVAPSYKRRKREQLKKEVRQQTVQAAKLVPNA